MIRGLERELKRRKELERGAGRDGYMPHGAVDFAFALHRQSGVELQHWLDKPWLPLVDSNDQSPGTDGSNLEEAIVLSQRAEVGAANCKGQRVEEESAFLQGLFGALVIGERPGPSVRSWQQPRRKVMQVRREMPKL